MEFKERVKEIKTDGIHILQMNIGKKCNLSCTHCHVMAGPARDEMMSMETFLKAMEVYDKYGMDTIDITGGEPTIHPQIGEMMKEAANRGGKILLRTNLVGLEKRPELIKLFKENNVDLIASMPCYMKENVDAMRGDGTFEKIVEAIRALNSEGYGEGYKLDLVYNPGGAFLPGPQADLEGAYKEMLGAMGLKFSNLFCMTNIPLGHFKTQLEEKGELEEYNALLEDSFNPATVESLMCRYQISVSFDGKVYDCDFHQMTDLGAMSYKTLDDLLVAESAEREVKLADYCYGCTAGAGSSCGGALNG